MNLNKFGLYSPFPKGMSFGGGGAGGGGGYGVDGYVFRYPNDSGTGDIGNISNWKVRTGLAVSAATRLPISSDDVFLYGEITSDSSGGHFTAKGSVKSVTNYVMGSAFPDYYTFNGVMYVSGNPFSGVYNGTYYVDGVAGTGTFDGVYYVDGNLANGVYDGVYYVDGVETILTTIYWQDSGSGAWEDPNNWWVDDTAIIPAGFAPWIDSDIPPTYLSCDLTSALGATNAPTIGVTIGTDATGTCNIAGISNNGGINGGTFSGDNFINNYGGTIYGGTFSGDNFTNYGGIYGGTFSGYGPDPYPMFALGIFTGGYNGTYYTNGVVDYTFTGLASDYYLDPTGITQYFFLNGIFATGGYNGQHYTSGIADSFTGIDYDFYYGEDFLYVAGDAGYGGWGQYHYSSAIDSFTGVDVDYGNGTDLSQSGRVYLNGSAITWVGGWNGVLYSPWSGYDLISGLFPDYYIDSTGQTLSYFSYGNSDGTAVYINYPDPSDVRSGVSYGLTVPQKVGTLSISNGGGGSSSGINLGQLIGLPSFIQL